MSATPRQILDFWFKETPPERRFAVDPAMDAEIRARFEESWRQAQTGAFQEWHATAEGALALIVLCDQFSRNMFRGQAESFASDGRARETAREALKHGFDLEAPAGVRSFFYLPFMHSENLDDQELCVRLTVERLAGDQSTQHFALRHRDAVARFGRFPARNKALGRTSTPEEEEYLRTNPAGF